eukprot:COSAG06_NODE_3803_length_4890_cov_8.042162_1_plen_322_part_00
MPPTTRRAARDATNLLTATPDEAALIIVAALTDPRDLLRLARACRRFAIKCIAAPLNPASGGTAAAAQQAEMWSIAAEAARQWIADCTDQERGWVPRRGRESWLSLMWEVQSLRRGAALFGRSHQHITLSEGGARAMKGTAARSCHLFRAAASKVVMRAGRHYAQFTAVVSDNGRHYGVIRPGLDVEAGANAFLVSGNSFYDTSNGGCWEGNRRWESDRSWEGMQTAMEQGDRIGMLLDFDQGSMTVYKNDEWLGVMATGLSGEYCWAVSLYHQDNSVRIEAAAAPASPTVEEVAKAKAAAAAQAAVAAAEEAAQHTVDDY